MSKIIYPDGREDIIPIDGQEGIYCSMTKFYWNVALCCWVAPSGGHWHFKRVLSDPFVPLLCGGPDPTALAAQNQPNKPAQTIALKIIYPDGTEGPIPSDGEKCKTASGCEFYWSKYGWIDLNNYTWHFVKDPAIGFGRNLGPDPIALAAPLQNNSPASEIVYPNGSKGPIPCNGDMFSDPASATLYLYSEPECGFRQFLLNSNTLNPIVHFVIDSVTQQVFCKQGSDPVAVAASAMSVNAGGTVSVARTSAVPVNPNLLPNVGNQVYLGDDGRFFVTKIEPLDKPCQHSWKKYVGFTDSFDYCEHCDEKKRNK